MLEERHRRVCARPNGNIELIASAARVFGRRSIEGAEDKSRGFVAMGRGSGVDRKGCLEKVVDRSVATVLRFKASAFAAENLAARADAMLLQITCTVADD